MTLGDDTFSDTIMRVRNSNPELIKIRKENNTFVADIKESTYSTLQAIATVYDLIKKKIVHTHNQYHKEIGSKIKRLTASTKTGSPKTCRRVHKF